MKERCGLTRGRKLISPPIDFFSTNGRVRKQAEGFGNIWFLRWRRVVCWAPLNSRAPAFVPSISRIPSSRFGYIPEFSTLLQGKHYSRANASVPLHLIPFISHSSTCLLCVLWRPTTRCGIHKRCSPHVILVPAKLNFEPKLFHSCLDMGFSDSCELLPGGSRLLRSCCFDYLKFACLSTSAVMGHNTMFTMPSVVVATPPRSVNL